MTHPASAQPDDTPPRQQDFVELQTASKLVGQLEAILETIGNCGVTNAATSTELDQYLGGAYAAAYRWLLEKRLDTDPNRTRTAPSL